MACDLLHILKGQQILDGGGVLAGILLAVDGQRANEPLQVVERGTGGTDGPQACRG